MDEFVRLGRTAFLGRYGYGKSRDFMVRDAQTGQLCDSKAIVGAAYGHQFPAEGPLRPGDFSGGEATVVPRLQRLGFEVVRIGEDWTAAEVEATVASYFEMLRLEATQERYTKARFNAELRQQLQRFVLDHSGLVAQVVDAMEEVKTPAQQSFHASVVAAPSLETALQLKSDEAKPRLPRKIDWAQRDEANRKLGRAGEQWVIDFEQRRLSDAGYPELFQQLDWVSDRLGDGTGYDILSHERPGEHRFIEVKTTNGGHASSFIISRNELAFAAEREDAFYLYRVFQFRQEPKLYILKGNLVDQLHLEPIDYRASFRRLVA